MAGEGRSVDEKVEVRGVHICAEAAAGGGSKSAQLAEELGFDSFWIADSQLLCRELYVTLTACALGTSTDKARGGGDGALYPTRERYGGGVCLVERTGAGSGDPGGEHGEQPGEDDRPEAGADCGDGGVCREADGVAGQQGRGVRRGGAGRDFVAGEAHGNTDLRGGHGAEDDKGGGKVDIQS